MISEFENGAYNKSNCIAMLNTLYPIGEPSINASLSEEILERNRMSLWKCITHYEKNSHERRRNPTRTGVCGAIADSHARRLPR